jgi:phosphogluconate dehydratase
MAIDPTVARVTERIIYRSRSARRDYLDRMSAAVDGGVKRAHLSCGNQAHAYAAMGTDKDALAGDRAPNLGIVTAYNDMLSAHQPFETYPQRIKRRRPRGRRHGAGGGRRAGDVRRGHAGPDRDGAEPLLARCDRAFRWGGD